MNVIIIDDEPLARSIVKEYLQSFLDIHIVAECNDGFEGMKAILQYEPELIFLDIQMPKINGFEMLELIENPLGVKRRQKIKVIPCKSNHFPRAADDYVKIVTKEGTFLKKRTMSFFETSLALYQFVRIHRSYIVNTQLITRIDPYEKDGHLVLLSTGAKLQASRSGYARLKEVLGI